MERILYNTKTGHAIGRIWCIRSLSIEDCIVVLGGHIITDSNDPDFDVEYGNVVMPSGRRFRYEDLEVR